MRAKWIMCSVTLLISMLAFTGFPAGAAEKKDGNAKTPYRVYFIGHSLYSFGSCNVPAAVQYLSEVAQVDRPIQATTFIKGGARHEDYLNSPEVMKRLREEPWDIVIIAGNMNDMAHPERVNLEYAKKLDQEVKSRQIRLLEYVAWPWVKVSGDQIFEQRMRAQEAFNQPLLDLAKETGATLVPSGPGLVNVIKKDQKFLADLKYGEVHISPLGYYFTACVLFASIYNQNPEGLPSVFREYNIDKETARILQATAWETVQEWRRLQADQLPKGQGPEPKK
ncbi:MAG: SGNH/GDSL hydrolase family protein [Tepidisphaeraceae bacterium]